MIVGYTRVSTSTQQTDNQKLALLEYAQANHFNYDKIVEVVVSSKKNRTERDIDVVLNELNSGDKLICYSLDRIGRSTLETLQIIEDIKNKGIVLILIKDKIVIDKGNSNPLNEMFLTLLSAFAQLERSFISERTKLGLQARKEAGVILGRKKGQIVKSKYDEHKERIRELALLGVSNKRILEHIKTGTEQSLGQYIKSRKLRE